MEIPKLCFQPCLRLKVFSKIFPYPYPNPKPAKAPHRTSRRACIRANRAQGKFEFAGTDPKPVYRFSGQPNHTDDADLNQKVLSTFKIFPSPNPKPAKAPHRRSRRACTRANRVQGKFEFPDTDPTPAYRSSDQSEPSSVHR